MKRAVAVAVLVVAAAGVSAATAHASQASPAARPAAEDAEPANDSSTEVSGDLSSQSAMAAIPWRTAFTSNVHNKVVHFPLALGMAAAVILIVAPRWPVYAPTARVLLIAAALASVAAFFSGEAQEGQFDDSPFHAVVEVHQRFGIGTAITLWAGVALTFWGRARRFLPAYGVILILLLVATGFLGGVLSHS